MPPSPPEPALPADRFGEGRPTVALLHGFTQTARSWWPVAEALAEAATVVVPDLPGHGRAGDRRGDLATIADAVAATVADDGPVVVVGYSMGGRVALRLALDHPGTVRALVLLGATAGIDHADERADRRAADGALAQRIEDDGVPAFVDRWLAQPLFAGLPADDEDRAARVANPAAGLAASLRQSGTGTMDPPWWPELAAITCPVLVLAGDRDDKFTILGRRLDEAIGPSAVFETVADAGHAAHLERPAAVIARLRTFLATVTSSTTG